MHGTEHHGVRDFAAPDLQPTLEGAQKPIAIGPRIFELQSSKQLTASSPRLRGEPCVQLLSDLRQRVRSPAPPLLFRFGQRSRPRLAVFPCNAEARQGHCQVNRSQNELAPTRPMCGASSRLLDARLLLPDPKGFRPDAAIMACAEAVTPWPEMAVDDGVR